MSEDIRTHPANDAYRSGFDRIDWHDDGERTQEPVPVADLLRLGACPCIDDPSPDQGEACARCEAGEDAGREPVRKVTECVGEFYTGLDCIMGDGSDVYMNDLLPEAIQEGEHGRWRITVEFWPETP